jgi:thiamine biosynthesis protein ThiS
MRVQINGESREVADAGNLAALIEALGMKADRIAVELNGDIIQRGKWAETPVHDGDKLEVVHFVGGG